PDGDEFNQIFQPVFTSGFDPYDFNLKIYNRWGQLVFESNDNNQGWDGTYGGELVQDGLYTWKIEFKSISNDERFIHTGHVNLLK
ncbi:MAG: gliding motility-associated C-terminal domain-containing protein, partial [Crocinitomicaceae bacterium]